MVDTVHDKAQEKDTKLSASEKEQENRALINLVEQEMTAKYGSSGLVDMSMPDSKLGKYGLVTGKALMNLPEGIGNSIVHNVTHPLDAAKTVLMGAGTAAVLKTVLPEAGPAGKIAAAGIGLYFTYEASKPIIDGYKKAGNASSMQELDSAASQIGNAAGDFLVNGAIAYGGYKIGAHYTDMALGSAAGQKFVASREGFYDNVTQKVSSITDTLLSREPKPALNLDMTRPTGAIPKYVLDEIAKRDPAQAKELAKTMNFMAELEKKPGPVASPRGGTDALGKQEVYDAKGMETEGSLVRSEGQAPTGNKNVDLAYDFTDKIRTFYQQQHNRLSIDGKGMPYRSTVNYGEGFENAFWNGERMTYGNPGANSPFKTFMLLDVAGHEVTHGITEMEAGTVYRNQAGALNESFSDVWGSLIKQWSKGQTAEKADWLIGEGIWQDNIKGKALRDMKNPGTAYNDPAIGKDPQPAHMKDYNNTRGDNGGVHYNSGIPNRAFANFAIDVGGKAWEKPSEIWWAARKAAGSNPTFSTFAYQTIEQAKTLGHTDLVPKLQKAWDSVGVKPSAKAVELPPPMPTSDGSGSDGVKGKLPPFTPTPEVAPPRKVG